MTEHPVRVRVAFNAPDPAHIELQGPALRAYHRWVEDGGSFDSENDLADAIYEQCEDYILNWSTLDTWDEEN